MSEVIRADLACFALCLTLAGWSTWFFMSIFTAGLTSNSADALRYCRDAFNYRDLQKDAFDENTSSDIKKTRRWQLDVRPHVGEPPRVLSTDIRHAACCLT